VLILIGGAKSREADVEVLMLFGTWEEIHV
jgi:hypothetical protein